MSYTLNKGAASNHRGAAAGNRRQYMLQQQYNYKTTTTSIIIDKCVAPCSGVAKGLVLLGAVGLCFSSDPEF